MSANLGSVLILVAAFLAATILVLGSAMIRSKNKRAELDRQGGDRLSELVSENEALRGRLVRQDERIAVLERIATDPAERTAREIELLRN